MGQKLNTGITIICYVIGIIGLFYYTTPLFSLVLVALSIGLFLENNKAQLGLRKEIRFFIFAAAGGGFAWILVTTGLDVFKTTQFFMLLIIIALFFANRVLNQNSCEN
jgi:hypothetical protein